MSPPRIIRSASARRDLDDIWDYLAVEAGPWTADMVLERLYDAFQRAAQQPLIYHKRPEYTGAPRRINVFQYAVFYEPLPEGVGIFLWRVVHGARDLPALMMRPVKPEEGDG